jgi:hypothetical protein
MANNNTLTISMRDMDRLVDWMRRSGHPQTIESLTRRWLEMLREDRGIKTK